MRRNASSAPSSAHAVPSSSANSSRAQSQRPGPLELALQLVAQLEQVDRVLRGVVEHPLRQRPHRPVGALVLLVELHAEVPLEQRGEAERAEAEQLRCDARVEDVADVPAVVLLEQTQIVVGVVKDDLDRRILEHAPERRRASRWVWGR